ncbi:hypothetical protein ACAW75_11630 [Fibrella sp. Tmos10]
MTNLNRRMGVFRCGNAHPPWLCCLLGLDLVGFEQADEAQAASKTRDALSSFKLLFWFNDEGRIIQAQKYVLSDLN